MSTIRTRVFFSIVTAFVVINSAQAQWNPTFQAPGSVTCIKWLQEIGARLAPPQPLLHEGFIGGAQFILYCPSGGDFTAAASVPLWNEGYITDFAFEDQNTGYASIYGASPTFYSTLNVSGLLKTTDGGATWAFVQGAPPEIRGLFYNWTNGLLFCSSGGTDDKGNGTYTDYAGAYVSSDHGQTWQHITVPNDGMNTSVANWCYYTGFASWNGTDIVLATLGSPNPCDSVGFPEYPPYWLGSHDGGLNWSKLQVYTKSWQPVALKNSPFFYASTNENNLSQIWTSSDNGYAWRLNSFSQSTVGFTECMAGDPCLIVAPDLNNPSHYYSTDDGKTWSFLSGGGPVPPADARFYVGGDSVWLFQGSAVSAIARPAPKALHRYPDSDFYAKSGCYPSDTTVSLYSCNCSNLSITGSHIDLVGRSHNNFTFKTAPQNGALCGPASYRVTYRPDNTEPDTALIIVDYTSSGTPQHDTLHTRGNGAPTDFFTDWTRITLPQIRACQVFDTFVTVINPTCSALQVNGAPGRAYEQKSGASTTAMSVPPQSFPYTVLQGSSQQIPIHVLTTTTGDYEIEITITAGGKQKKVYADITVKDTVKPFLRTFNIVDTFDCNRPGKFDSAVYYFDTTCENVTINNITITPPGDFEIVGLTYPIKVCDEKDVIPGCSYYLRVPIKIKNFTPGKQHCATIQFNDVMDDGHEMDTKGTICYTILKARPLTPKSLTLTNLPFNGGNCVSPCDSSKVTFMVQNADPCQYPMRITKVVPSFTGGNYTSPDLPKVGDVLTYNQIRSFSINWPFGATTTPPPGNVQITYISGPDSGTATVQYTFSGFVCPPFSGRLIKDSANFQHLIADCDSVDIWDTICNSSCGNVSVLVNSVRGDDLKLLKEPTEGAVIEANACARVHLQFKPTASDVGLHTGTITFHITGEHDPNGNDLALNWSGEVVRAPFALSFNSILRPDSLPCNTPWDTDIVVRNIACGRPITITAATIPPLPGLTLTNGSLPVTLAQGDTFALHLHGLNTGTLPGSWIDNVSISGDTSFTIPFNTSYQGCGGKDIVTLSTPDSVFITSNCTSKGIVYSVSVVGSTHTVNFAVSGQNFSQSPSGTLPANLGNRQNINDTVTYGPAVNDTSHGTLTVTIDGTPRTIPLTGMSSGTPAIAHIGIDGASLGKNFPGQIRTVDMVLRDDIDRNIGVTNAIVSLSFTNDNILTVTAATEAGGWHLVTPQSYSTVSPVPIKFTIDNSSSLAAGTTIGKAVLNVSVGNTDTGSIYVSAVHFNDKQFEDCTLKGAPAPDILGEQVIYICGDSTLQDVLNYGKVIRFSIHPNPASKSSGSAASLELTSNIDQDATVDLLDISGKTVSELSRGTLMRGDHVYPIPTAQLAEGTYFVRVRASGETVAVRKFVLQKE